MKRGQTSTEYIILVAIVIVIAVVVSSILGDFTVIGSGTNKNLDDYKLTTKKVAVDTYGTFESENYTLVKIRNNHFETLIANTVTIDDNSAPCVPQNVTLNTGQSTILNCSGTVTTTPDVSIIWTDVSTDASYTIGENISNSPSISENCSTVVDEDGDGEGQCGDSDCSSSEYCIVSSLRDGLVGYWPLDETSGLIAYDNSSSGNDGNIYGDVLVNQPGVVGTSMSFDGSSDYVTLGVSGLPTGSSSRTVCSWIKSRVLTNYHWAFGYGSSAYGGGSVGYSFAIGQVGDRIGVSGYGHDLWSGNLFTINDWFYLCVSYDGSIGKVYVNGLLNSSNSRSYNTGSSAAYIGRQVPITEYWNGYVDELAIWNRDLNSTEVQQLYNTGSGRSLKLN